jgi:hypothetical protein
MPTDHRPPPAAETAAAYRPCPAVDPGGTRVERRLRPVSPAPAPIPKTERTVLLSRIDALDRLAPEERRLVAFVCALRARQARELLEMVEPARAAPMLDAAAALTLLDRAARLSVLRRTLQIPACAAQFAQFAQLADTLRRERAWVAQLADRVIPAAARRHVPAAAPLRPRSPHPALETWVRRLVARILTG